MENYDFGTEIQLQSNTYPSYIGPKIYTVVLIFLWNPIPSDTYIPVKGNVIFSEIRRFFLRLTY